MTMMLWILVAGLAAAAAALLHANARLRRERDRLLRTTRKHAESATHELHTPITAILGYQELLAEGIYGPLPPQAEEAVDRIGRATRQLVYLVDGLLDAVLLDAGPLQMDVHEVALRPVLRHAVEDAEALATERGATLRAAADLDQLPETAVTDPERVRRILGLTLMAAIRASAGRELGLAFRALDGRLEMDVTGTGLSADALDPDGGRVSLRLTVARRIARALGGDVAVQPTGPDTASARVRVALH